MLFYTLQHLNHDSCQNSSGAKGDFIYLELHYSGETSRLIAQKREEYAVFIVFILR